MVLNANEIENKYNKRNNGLFEEDIKWIERQIDFTIERKADILLAVYNSFSYKEIKISHSINTNLIKFDVVFGGKRESFGHRNIHNSNFYKAFEILQEKYKEQGWIICFKPDKNYYEIYKFIYIKKDIPHNNIKKTKLKSFCKSFFSKKNKKYPSVLEELEEKYSQE